MVLSLEGIRVDSPRGEIDRTYALSGPDGETLTFKAINRGKKGITLRLNTKEGAAILEELVRRLDVLFTTLSPALH